MGGQFASYAGWPRRQGSMNVTSRFSSIALTRRGLDLAVAGAFAILVASCGQSQQQGGAPPPPAVTVTKPVKRMVSDFDEYVGRFTAINSVEVRARVSGYLDGVHFKDGQIVKQGDLLFTIDKRPFRNTLDQARANLAQAKSDIEFTELRAPVNGRIGDRRVSPGNLVTGGTSGNTTMLGTIVSTDPIYFEFTFDEASFLRYERAAMTGTEVAGHGAGVPVKLKLIDEPNFEHEGRMDFVDNVIERSTGTIRGRAVFANPNNVFTPGMFGRVQVPASSPYEALLVPDLAIGTEQARKYVLVVDASDTVRQKYVTLGQVTPDGLRIIKQGLEPNDRVIIAGLMLARAGMKVRPQEQGAGPAATGAPRAPTQQSSK